MIKNAAIAGFIALLFLTACSKQEPAATAPAADPAATEQEPVASAPAEPTPPPPQDYSKTATGMISLLAETPECQHFTDELKAIAQTPLGSQPSRDPALVVAEAHSQGCSKKAQAAKAGAAR